MCEQTGVVEHITIQSGSFERQMMEGLKRKEQPTTVKKAIFLSRYLFSYGKVHRRVRPKKRQTTKRSVLLDVCEVVINAGSGYSKRNSPFDGAVF